MSKHNLIATDGRGETLSLDSRQEYTTQGSSLEVMIPNLDQARIRTGTSIFERFQDFFPFNWSLLAEVSAGVGIHPTDLRSFPDIDSYVGIQTLIKHEHDNPTGSFKDRGTIPIIAAAREFEENTVITISTGNMGKSLAKYGVDSGLTVRVYASKTADPKKLALMEEYGAAVIVVEEDDFSAAKLRINREAEISGERITTGNNPIRVEGYKAIAFEMFEQMNGQVPDYISVPTSTGGNIRGIFKGYLELQRAGIIDRLPRMVVVQAEAVNSIVADIRGGEAYNLPTIASAITSFNPPGGVEIAEKARIYGWPAVAIPEAEIISTQQLAVKSGLAIEPSSATAISAIKLLTQDRTIGENATVVAIATGRDLD